MSRMFRAVLLAVCMATPAFAQDQPQIWYRPELLVQIGVSNLDRAIEFYTKTLEFKLTERINELKFAHIDTNVPGLQIGLNEVPAPKGSGSIVLNISVANVIATRKQMEARGLKFRGETQIIPGKVALAEFADPDGNILRFAGPPPAKPSAQDIACTDPAARALDFWVGVWEVRNARGQVAATSTIEPLADGCGVLERYMGAGGGPQRYVGAGLHAFDRATTSWKQLWTDNRPAITEMQGRETNGAVVYEWRVNVNGKPAMKRYTLSRVEGGVRQLGEGSSDGGSTWAVEFDLRYKPKA